MTDSPSPSSNSSPDSTAAARQIGVKARRKLWAERHPAPGAWFGLGRMGLIGWSVVMPTLLGTAAGLWLDRHYPINHSWTLALLVAGLVIGCFNAWHWVSMEAQHIEREGGGDGT